MPSYKLTYFNARGRIEGCRYLFALAKADYEDYRFTEQEWPKIKPTTPFGMVPLLEVDGVQIAQSIAITRFIGEEFGFAPESNLDKARGDMIAESVNDLVIPTFAFFEEMPKEKKDKALEAYTQEKVPGLLRGFERILKENNGGDGFFVGNKVTWVDLYAVSHFVDIPKYVEAIGGELSLADYPKLTALIARVQAIPEIKAVIDGQPADDGWIAFLKAMEFK